MSDSVNKPLNRKVLITGGTGSVGQAMVRAFAANYETVFFQYSRDEAAAAKLAAETGAHPVQLDFASEFTLPCCDFDIVVNNAGINISDVSAHEVTLDAWNKTILVNLSAPFRIARVCIPSMIKKQWGRIINISSVYGMRVADGNLPYTVSKHGLSGLTKTIAREYAAHEITCNEICPGPIDSEMMRAIAARASTENGSSVADYFAEVCDEIPAKRMAQPDEVAALAIFLASSQAGYINGASIPVDGGLTT